ncbi:U-box domain-containing protein 27 [Apostasia shenzhenica]|uniref:U-box domain-containing protein n=1 Tax=Apostasia shenzhenica TaxID=1088818 RepID=A0A2I0AS15_9ASPA|nr:U-box domain-containing protein 27 [Apostasia shenzhenica]
MREKGSESNGVKGKGAHLRRLDINKAAPPPPPPSLFRCPISLEVMRSPVSLCTGVTYDRSSIQRWLESGNTTCPATMQPLVSTDLVPNLTLRRLIHLWYSSATDVDGDIPPLSDLARFLSDPSADEADKLRLLSTDSLKPAAIARILCSPAALLHETLEPAVRIVSLLLSLDFVELERKRVLIESILSHPESAVSTLISLLKGGARLPSRIAAARVLEAVLSSSSSDSDLRMLMVDNEDLVVELLRLIGEPDNQAIDAGLQCLMALIAGDSSTSSSASSAEKKARAEMVRAGAMAVLTRVLAREATDLPPPAAERAMCAMAVAAACAEGRTAIYQELEVCVAAVMGKMMKLGNEGREAAVAILWSVCCAGGGNRRSREALTGAKGGMAKILMVMQGECSPTGRRMAADLLRVFRPGARSSIAGGCDSKTMHIMPY